MLPGNLSSLSRREASDPRVNPAARKFPEGRTQAETGGFLGLNLMGWMRLCLFNRQTKVVQSEEESLESEGGSVQIIKFIFCSSGTDGGDGTTKVRLYRNSYITHSHYMRLSMRFNLLCLVYNHHSPCVHLMIISHSSPSFITVCAGSHLFFSALKQCSTYCQG